MWANPAGATVTAGAPPRRLTGERVAAIILALVLVVVVFANNWGVLTPDTKPEIFVNSWRTAIDFGVYGAPETFLVDADGIVRWKHVGPLSDDIVRNELLPALAAAERRK